jgi:hypothetical protein
MTTNTVANIVYSAINKADCVNVMYQKHNSAFDLILDALNFNLFDNKNIPAGIYPNLYVSNDPINFSQYDIHKSNENHINSIVFFHDGPLPQFKKEDILILKQHIQKKYKILLNSELVKKWLPSDNKWSVIDYGIPDLGSINTQKNNNAVLLNINNNRMVASVYEAIQKYIPKTLVLNTLPKDIDELYSILQDSIICVDLENNINSLVAAVCECVIIASYDNTNLPYSLKIDRLDNIHNMIKIILNNIDQKQLQEQKKLVLDSYPFDLFAHRISSLFNSVAKEKFIL